MATKRRQNAGKVTVASGTGPAGPWVLTWPRHLWEELTGEERVAVVARQRALLEADNVKISVPEKAQKCAKKRAGTGHR